MRKFLLLIALLTLSVSLHAQGDLSQKLMPIDSSFIVGRLDNGMKYYIKENKKPEGLADFYIARSVGAIQEDDHQDGLAHFLEHMAFNGTKNLPGKAMLEYLQSIGAEFGANINAYTGLDRTVYILNDIPLRRQAIIDSALLVLYEWSRNLTLDPVEVDNERGVILEELRSYYGASFRVREKLYPYVYNGTKYQHKNVLGTEEGLKTFAQESIESFYYEWYRPEYQAVIVVGDFDARKMEQEIVEMFSELESPENVRDKVDILIPEYAENTFAVITDPENTSTYVEYIIPSAYIDSASYRYYDERQRSIMESIIEMSLDERLSDVALESNPPFNGASVSPFLITNTSYGMIGYVSVKESGVEDGLTAMVAQIEKIRKYGITNEEFNRNILELRTQYEAAVQREADKKSSQYVSLALTNFLQNEPIQTDVQKLEIFELMVATISLEMVNDYVSFVYPDKPGAVVAITPEKEGVVPTVEQLEAAFMAGKNANLPAPVESVIASSLITEPIEPGQIVKESVDKLGNTVWTLSNGATLVLHPTTLKQDEILFSGSGYGGSSYVETADMPALKFVSSVASLSGLGDFSASELQKIMVGKRASANVGIANTQSNVSGNSSSKLSDIETMLQQVYLKFEKPRFEQVAFQNFVLQYKNMLANFDQNPNNIFSDGIQRDLYGGNERIVLTRDMNKFIDDITLEQVQRVYNTAHQGVDGYRFVMVGNFEPDSIRPLVENYLASIKAGEKRQLSDDKTYLVDGEIVKDYPIQMHDPKSLVLFYYEGGEIKYTLKNTILMGLLAEMLDFRYTEIIREEKGAAYYVSVNGYLSYEPRERFTLQVQFETNPELANEMANIVEEQIQLIADGTIKDEDFNKAITARIKNFELAQKENGAWLSWINSYYNNEFNYEKEYLDILKSIKPKQIVDIAKEILSEASKKRLIMYPAEN
ncbi:MAG: insulinase family protein [Rikenellaceae bacterium]